MPMAVKPPIRWRNLTLNRRHDLSKPIELDEMRVDRLALRVEVTVGYSSRQAIADYLHHLNGANGLPFTLFEVTSAASSHIKKVRIIDRRRLEHEAFALTGGGKISGVAQDRGTARLTLDLSLNPTRWFAQQPIGAHSPGFRWPDHAAVLAARPVHECLERRPQALAAAARQSLDGKPNVLLGYNRTGPGWPDRDPHAWAMDWTGFYVNAVRELVALAVDPGGTIPGLMVTITPPTVSQVEVYGERMVEDALAAVAALGDRLMVAASDLNVRLHLSGALGFGRELNARTITLPVARNIHVVIYAKTQDRLRFEVRYLDDVRGTVARHRRGPTDPLETIRCAMQNAVERLATVTDALAGLMVEAPASYADLKRGLWSVLWACEGDQSSADALLTPLLVDQAVTETGPGGLAPRRVLQRLRARGVVQRVRVRHGGAARWALTPTYAAAIRLAVEQLPDRRLLVRKRQA